MEKRRRELQLNPVHVALVVVLGSFMMVLDSTVMNVALPALQTYFSNDGVAASYSMVAWTVTGYTLAQAAVLPLTDWLARRWGTRNVYLFVISLFTISSLACAVAPNLGVLILMRVIQGFGGGCVMPLGTTMVAQASGPERLGRMMSIMGVPMMLAPVLGPVIGGWLIEIGSWHWIFLINVPVGVLAIAAGLFVLPNKSPVGRTPIDGIGLALMSPGLALLLWGFTNLGNTGGVSVAFSALPMIAGLILVSLFVYRTFRADHPLLDLRVLRVKQYRRCVWVMIAYQSGFFGANLLIPSYLQQVHGMSAIEAGLLMAPAGIGSIITMPIASSLIDRLPPGRVIPFGMMTLGCSLLAFTVVSAQTSGLVLALILLLQGFGLGGTMMPTATSALKQITAQDLSNATTVWNIIQQVATSVGVASAAVLLSQNASGNPLNAAFTQTFWLPVAIMLVGFIFALRLPTRCGPTQ